MTHLGRVCHDHHMTTTRTAAQAHNRIAAQAYQAAVAEVTQAAADGGYPIEKAIFDLYEDATAALHRSAVALALVAQVGETVVVPDGTLVVVNVVDTTSGPLVTLTADGHMALGAWDDAIGQSAPVYYERYSAEGRVAHGWVDSVSRKIVQVG